jgi:predicted ATP-grasp superfamily ATP-dependent carboligase
MEVIVLDGNQRPALAIVRSLGSRGIRVTVGAETSPSLASRSRFCAGSFAYPSPYEDPAGFLQAVLDRTRTFRRAILIPVTDVTLGEILGRREEFAEGIAIPFEDFGKFRLVSDKVRLTASCRKMEIPVPLTFSSEDFRDAEALIHTARSAGFPLVVKPAVSRIRTDGGWVDAAVRYARTEEELRAVLATDQFARGAFLVQERVRGPGVGIFLLMKDGTVMARFAHRRIREKPPSGGVSVLCESIEPPAAALNAATRLLGEVRWNGVAMAEFKIDERDGVPKMLEVNARFWGSLQLAVSSGVDFPFLLVRMARGEEVCGPVDYRVGLKVRWELGDLDHLWLRLFRDGSRLSLPSRSPSRPAVLASFVADSLRPSVRNEVFRFRDAGPFLHELGRYVRDAVTPHPRGAS